MNEKKEIENEEKSMVGNQDIINLLKKMQYKIDSMEEKIDSLVRRSRQKTFTEKPSSRLHKDYERPRRPKVGKYEGKKDEDSSEGKFYHGRPFGRKKDRGKSDFKKGRKFFSKTKKSTRSASDL